MGFSFKNVKKVGNAVVEGAKAGLSAATDPLAILAGPLGMSAAALGVGGYKGVEALVTPSEKPQETAPAGPDLTAALSTDTSKKEEEEVRALAPGVRGNAPATLYTPRRKAPSLLG